ncbi:hypothetical protein GS429_19395 [Natronorubrum sp. JWXQ-INN-674]|uniref:Acyl-CoA dehydrogenase/oxidase N-terminal domain-containing protein n=1 Tax=Natronorubrum halalkaliphilum TaxID=2691917 RepID=A0A6B0VQW3_9EURY|nr:acyl-CoA dehydrogenase family protein [Natronorubrum halalkaliphilum]MXV64191.1 hypothetical protein [Natronorubrum halalkaliphilum]
MDTALPDEHRAIRDPVNEFCETEIEPIAQFVEAEYRFPSDIFEQFAGLETLGAPVTETNGGFGEGALPSTLGQS